MTKISSRILFVICVTFIGLTGNRTSGFGFVDSFSAKKFVEQRERLRIGSLRASPLNDNNYDTTFVQEDDPGLGESSISAMANKSSKPRRTISRMEKFARLPVWPVWQGVLIFFLSKVFGEEFGAKLEDQIGGRVCPNFFQNTVATSPFIMLVHHRHSFVPWDLLRYFIANYILPEGFPAHAHRGFITVTYCLRGGMVHRDSLGIKQIYGAEERHNGKDVQWLNTGSGMLHEEMWDIETEGLFGASDQELYQLWLNVPASEKMCAPKVELLGKEDMPIVNSNGSTIKVIAGEFKEAKGSVNVLSSLNIYHVEIEPNKVLKIPIPDDHETGVLYMRKGSVIISNDRIPPHYTAYLDSYGDELVIESGSDGADFLLLTGAQLREPVSAQGSMVMNTQNEIDQAYQDYSLGKMGNPWSHTLKDAEWKDHVQKFPSIYKVAKK